MENILNFQNVELEGILCVPGIVISIKPVSASDVHSQPFL